MWNWDWNFPCSVPLPRVSAPSCHSKLSLVRGEHYQHFVNNFKLASNNISFVATQCSTFLSDTSLWTLKSFQIFKNEIKKWKTYKRLMFFSISRPIKWYHSHADPSGRTVPLIDKSETFNEAAEKLNWASTNKGREYISVGFLSGIFSPDRDDF